MAAVTIGVPVFNGDATLNECLECLATQTFSDFEVLIYDNASTDRTASIAKSWAARHGRFKYFRQQENRGGTQNFMDVLDAAKSEYFMWRADDDLSAPNFLEALYRKAVDTDAHLAVSTIRRDRDGSRRSDRVVPDLCSGPELFRFRRVLFRSHQSWFYGLWKRQALIETFKFVSTAYPDVWGTDHLTLFGPILDDKITGTNETYFIQGFRKQADGGVRNPAPSNNTVMYLRSEYIRVCSQMIKQRQLPTFLSMMLSLIVLTYARKRFHIRRKRWRNRIWRILSNASGLVSGR